MEQNKHIIYQISAVDLESIIDNKMVEIYERIESKLSQNIKLLNREEAANSIGVCPSTISAMVKRGDLHNYGIGRKLLILESQLKGTKKNRYTRY